MPWSKSKLPPAAKNLSDKQKEVFVAAANAALASEKDEGAAIAIGLAAAKKKGDKVKKSFTEALVAFVEKYFASTDETPPQVEVTKAVDDEQRMAMFVVLAPDEVDLHGDTYSAEEVEKACNNFNTHCNKANLFHKVETEEAKIVQSFISPSDFTLEDGREITKGTWVQWWSFPETDLGEEIWKAVKAGEITGVSIGAKAYVEKLDD